MKTRKQKLTEQRRKNRRKESQRKAKAYYQKRNKG